MRPAESAGTRSERGRAELVLGELPGLRWPRARDPATGWFELGLSRV